MEEQQKTVAGIKVNGNGKGAVITVSGVSVTALVGLIAWGVSAVGQIEGNAEALKKNAVDHKVIYTQLHDIKIENNTIKTLQQERHVEITKRLDRQEQKLDAIMEKLSK